MVAIIQDRTALDDALCRAMEPDAWVEYDAGNGVCSNQAGWKCVETVRHAGAVMDYLSTLGEIVVPAKATTPSTATVGLDPEDGCECGIGDMSDIGHFHESWCPGRALSPKDRP